jgi:hypothetical protein
MKGCNYLDAVRDVFTTRMIIYTLHGAWGMEHGAHIVEDDRFVGMFLIHKICRMLNLCINLSMPHAPCSMQKGLICTECSGLI